MGEPAGTNQTASTAGRRQLTWCRAKSQPQAKTDHEKPLLQRQIKTTDNQIYKFVYELYGLSDDEIGIAERVGY